ncbi:MAG: DUF4921 family protein [Micropruina glycogenica]
MFYRRRVRRVPNLFEILSYQYWNANYGYAPCRRGWRRIKAAYLDSPIGRTMCWAWPAPNCWPAAA